MRRRSTRHCCGLRRSSVHMLTRATTPTLASTSLAGLLDELDANPSHALAGPRRTRNRQVRLLRWLGTVRNKAVQHRVQEGYTDNAGIVLSDAYVLVRKPGEAPADAARKAKQLLRGLTRTYNIRLDETEGTHENLAYLDLVSPGLLQRAPGQADPARHRRRSARPPHSGESALPGERRLGARRPHRAGPRVDELATEGVGGTATPAGRRSAAPRTTWS